MDSWVSVSQAEDGRTERCALRLAPGPSEASLLTRGLFSCVSSFAQLPPSSQNALFSLGKYSPANAHKLLAP